tara:strand:+ start:67 stop:642 length:576 start_codon:yes stop_codon:yes gene_type:complete
MSEMKLIMENWKKYVTEAAAPVRGASKEASYEREAGMTRQGIESDLASAAAAAATLPVDPDAMTLGDLRTLVDKATTLLVSKQGKGELKSMATSVGTLGAKDLWGLIKSIAVLDDSVNMSKGLSLMNIDDEVSAIVDNNLENDFLLTLKAELASGTIPDSTPLGDLNLTKMLSNFLANKHDKRTVTVPEEN